MKSLILPAFVLCLGLLLAGCAKSLKVTTDHDPNAPLASFETWDWMPGAGDSTDFRIRNTDARKRIERSIAEVLVERGLSRSDDPDMRVNYYASVGSHPNVSTVSASNTAGYTIQNDDRRISEIHTSDWQDGMLVIDVMDGGSGNLVWRGVGQAKIEMEVTEDKAEARVRDAVSKILEQFPPR